MVKLKNFPYYQYEEDKYQTLNFKGSTHALQLELLENQSNLLCKMRKFTVPWKIKIDMHFNTSDIMPTIFIYTYFYLCLKQKH